MIYDSFPVFCSFFPPYIRYNFLQYQRFKKTHTHTVKIVGGVPVAKESKNVKINSKPIIQEMIN